MESQNNCSAVAVKRNYDYMATGMQRLNESSIFFSFSSGERCSFKVEVGCELVPITNSNTMRQTGRASSSNILWIREQRSDLKT